MIKIICDICGEQIVQYPKFHEAVGAWDHEDGLRRLVHRCSSCKFVLDRMDVSSVVAKEVVVRKTKEVQCNDVDNE